MKKTLIAALAVLTMSSSPAAHGQAAPGESLALEFLDTDGDGRISLEEFQSARLAWFDRADTNSDGVLSLSELRALRASGGAGCGDPRPETTQEEPASSARSCAAAVCTAPTSPPSANAGSPVWTSIAMAIWTRRSWSPRVRQRRVRGPREVRS